MHSKDLKFSAFRPMLLTGAKHAPAGDRWIHEIKYDGYRMLCHVTEVPPYAGKVEIGLWNGVQEEIRKQVKGSSGSPFGWSRNRKLLSRKWRCGSDLLLGAAEGG